MRTLYIGPRACSALTRSVASGERVITVAFVCVVFQIVVDAFTEAKMHLPFSGTHHSIHVFVRVE